MSIADRTTIAEIAKLAGVSVPTVSKVINGKPGVSNAKRLTITQLLHEHEYEPRRSAPTGVIAVVFGELSSPWSLALVSALERVAFDNDMGMLLTVMRPGTGEWVDMLGGKNVDGVIFAAVEVAPSDQERFRQLELPTVLVDPRTLPDSGTVTVGVTHWRGARAATDHLVDLGHQRIAMISGPRHLLFSQARVDGYRAALRSADIVVPEDYIVATEYGFAAGREAALDLLKRTPRPTAIFAASDEQALGIYEAARLSGLRIPADVSVVGFNDVPIAEWASPPLTTVREPIFDTAREAIRLLRVEMAEAGEAVAVELVTDLIIRESTAAPTL
ncbi:transcriptional regulator [Frondihabitans sucicola]|uniref:Transcriptional regulator n=1 Tax=Frondihabitans sucicola TaxID=1268041 RepID=A0ABM8GHX1_9MICO|nr:LacI family DNA-binding transcriptional regulator [Frondihabitans sucicola]BDZ47968.1 transcriptional regulator [Frondihabitans sucicola]